GLRWMQSAATRLGASICGSIAVRDAGRHYNRMYLVYPDGTYLSYDKRHLFRMGDEQQHYTPGTRRVVAEIDGWKFCLMVRYDLRCPVWSRCRNSADAAGGLIYEYDAPIYVANWPSVRS